MSADQRTYWQQGEWGGDGRGFWRARVTSILICVLFGLWIVFAILANRTQQGGAVLWIFDHLALHGGGVTGAFEPWQVLTYSWLHIPQSPMPVVYSAAFLFFLGRPLETMIGGRAYLRLYLLAGLAAALVAIPWMRFVDPGRAPELGLLDAGGCVYGVVVYYACRRPHDPSWFGLPLWGLVTFLIGLHVVTAGILGNGRSVALLGGALYGWLHHRFGERVGDAFASLSAAKAEATRQRKAAAAAAESAQVDALLEKIAASGIASLTEAEKALLTRASARRR